MLWVGIFERNAARTANKMPLKPDRPATNREWNGRRIIQLLQGCARQGCKSRPFSLSFLRVCNCIYLLACLPAYLRRSALTRSTEFLYPLRSRPPPSLPPPAKTKAVESGLHYAQNLPIYRSRTCKCGWAGRGDAMHCARVRSGARHKGCMHHQAGYDCSAAFCGVACGSHICTYCRTMVTFLTY